MANKHYSINELLALRELTHRHGKIFYINSFDIEREFFELTGVSRKSGPLYMAYWRMQNGYYDDKLAG